MPLSTSLRISMHPTWSKNVHFTLGQEMWHKTKSGFNLNIKGICGTEWYRLLTCFELYQGPVQSELSMLYAQVFTLALMVSTFYL